MKLVELKKMLTNIIKFFKKTDKKNKKIIKKINDAYNLISNNTETEVNKLVSSTFKKTAKNLQLEININKEQLKNLTNSKTKGLSIFNRLKISKNNFISQVKTLNFSDENKKTLKSKLKYEYFKVKRIIRTDSHRIREKTKNYVSKIADRRNIKYTKTWICIFKNSRDSHISMHGQLSDENGYFTAPTGEKTEFPGGFGVARLDINCQCRVKYERVKKHG